LPNKNIDPDNIPDCIHVVINRQILDISYDVITMMITLGELMT